MIHVIQHRAEDVSGWESCIGQCSGHGLLMPGIHLVEHDPSSVLLLRFEDEGRIVGCAVAVDLRPDWRGRLRRREHVLLLPTAPAIADASAASEVRAALFAYARGAGAERLVIRPAFGRWILQDEDLAAWRSGSITEFVIDTTRDYDDVLASMHKVHRKNIRRAARAGLEISVDTSLDGLLRLRTLQQASSDRAEERTEGFEIQDVEVFRRAHEHVYGPGLGTVLFARAGGEDVAALAWIEAAGRIQTVRSGSLPQGYETRAMYLLHDELIRRAQARNVREINIGGVPSEARESAHPQSGLYDFKQGFGGQAELRYSLDIRLEEIDS